MSDRNETSSRAAVGRPLPRRGFAADGDWSRGNRAWLLITAPVPALALQAVAHGNARWFALNRKVKLPATAGGASGHGSNSVLSMSAGVSAGLRNDAPWAAKSYDQLMSASLIGRSGSSAFRLSTTTVSMSLTGSRFSSESAPGPFHHGIRGRGGTIYSAALPSDER